MEEACLSRFVSSITKHAHRNIHKHRHTHSCCKYCHSTVEFHYCLFPQITWEQWHQKQRQDSHWNLCWCQRWCIETIWALKSSQQSNAVWPGKKSLTVTSLFFEKRHREKSTCLLHRTCCVLTSCFLPVAPVLDWQPDSDQACWTFNPGVDRNLAAC